MKHKSSRELYAYWTQRRGNRVAPERADIDPGAIRGALGDCFILSKEADAEWQFRLAGTRICSLFCRELKGLSFAGLWDADSRDMVDELAAVVAGEATGIVAGLVAEAHDQPPTHLEMVLLPLLHQGRPDARLIGVAAPSLRPYWLGLQPITSMALGSYRHVGPLAEEFTLPSLISAPPESTVRKGFIVYDGGGRVD